MPSVDKRVVQMDFQNAQFQKGVSETLGSLKSLTAQPPFYHLYVDTRSITSTAKLTTLENFIYGTSSVNPSMPTALQLKTMLA